MDLMSNIGWMAMSRLFRYKDDDDENESEDDDEDESEDDDEKESGGDDEYGGSDDDDGEMFERVVMMTVMKFEGDGDDDTGD